MQNLVMVGFKMFFMWLVQIVTFICVYSFHARRCRVIVKLVWCLLLILPANYVLADEEQVDLSKDNVEFIDKVAVVVNDGIILMSDLLKKRNEVSGRMLANGLELPSEVVLMEQVVDALVLNTLIQQRGKLLGVLIDDESINQQLFTIAQNNSLSVVELQQQLNGQSPNAFLNLRDSIRDQLLFERIKEREVYSLVQVSENELENAIKIAEMNHVEYEYHLKQILLPLPLNATADDKLGLDKKVIELYKRLRSGESFAQLAVRHSRGPKALDGGDLGWIRGSQLPTFFEDVVPNAPVGQLTDIIRSSIGLHIIKVQGKRNYDSVAKKVDAQLIRRQLLEKIASEETALWLQRLKDEALIQILYTNT